MNTICKFKCESVTDFGSGKTVKLSAVTGGSKENESFWKYTPNGTIEFHHINPNIVFQPGKEYLVTINEGV